MVKLTLIARVSDGLPLAEGLDSDKDHELANFKQQAKVGSMHASRMQWPSCTVGALLLFMFMFTLNACSSCKHLSGAAPAVSAA
jgi:hypothetical protein